MEIKEKIKKRTEELIEKLGFKSNVSIEEVISDEERKYLKVNIDGDDLSELIGFHGANLEAIQVVLGVLLRNELREEEYRLIVDVNDYRDKRIEQVKSIAKRAIMEVQELNQSFELAPMKSFERRIVHIVSKEEGMKSESIGDWNDRRVIIQPNN